MLVKLQMELSEKEAAAAKLWAAERGRTVEVLLLTHGWGGLWKWMMEHPAPAPGVEVLVHTAATASSN